MIQTAGPLPTIKFRCARCQQLLRVPAESLGNNARCPGCQLLMQIPEPRGKTAAREDGRTGLPWEQPGAGISSLFRTALLVCFKPSLAFGQMQRQGSLWIPIRYSLFCLQIGFCGTIFWQGISAPAWLPILVPSAAEFHVALVIVAGIAAAMLLVVAPLMATLGNLMTAGMLHLCLIIAGGSRYPFATSFRIACYTHSSLLLWLLFIPVGELAFGVWNVALQVFAIHRAHEVPMGRAVLAAVLPMVVLMVIVVIALVIFVGGLFWMLMRG